MKVTQGLLIPIYEFECDHSILDEIVRQFPFLEWNHPRNEAKMFYYKPLFDWLNECLLEVRDSLYNKDIKLEISDCWVNKLTKLQKVGNHFHVNSIVSGLLYFSDETTSRTVFSFPNPYYHAQNKNVLSLAENDQPIKTEVLPKKGKLLIWPSTISHNVTPYLGNGVRYSIAFNTFVSGNIHKEITRSLTLKTIQNQWSDNN